MEMRVFFKRSRWATGLAVAGALFAGVEGARAQAYDAGGGTASGTDAVAIGMGATASSQNGIALGYYPTASGLNAIAIGVGANASADHSTALGGGSVASRGGQTDYVAPFLTAPQTSVGEISVGNDTVQRQITHVAAGSAPTDAVNVAQLEGAITPLQAGVASLGTDLTALTGRVDRLDRRIEDTRDIAIAAGALSMAAAQLRFDDRPGKLSIAMGGGAFHGKGAGAIGLGYTSPDRLWRANVSGSFTDGESAFGGGVSFTLN
jgi:autotransporter adhesin